MTADPSAALAAIRAREQAATPGPWVHNPEAGGLRGCGDVWTAGPGVEGGSIAMPHGDLYPRGGYNPRGDMEFIAHARDDVRRMADALDAVLALHQPNPIGDCGCATEDYPCATVRAITDALGGAL